MILEIKDVPDDKDVVAEILRNAETTIRNYHSSKIRVVAPEKEVEFETAVAAFKLANKQAIKEEADGLIDNDGGAVKGDGIRSVGDIEPDPAKPANLEPKDSGEIK
jgi:hypothetical protein